MRFLLWGAPAALIVFAVSSVNLPDGKISRLACLLGDASYSIYLFQFFALPMWARMMWNLGAEQIPFDVNLLILTSLVVMTGLAGWFVIERPLGKMMRMVLKTQLSRFRRSRRGARWLTAQKVRNGSVLRCWINHKTDMAGDFPTLNDNLEKRPSFRKSRG